MKGTFEYYILYIYYYYLTHFCTSKLVMNKYNLVAKRDRINYFIYILYHSEKREEIYLM